ncbi:hypothetical protein PYCC9005_001181 [Savitreella phatthalungensis]
MSMSRPLTPTDSVYHSIASFGRDSAASAVTAQPLHGGKVSGESTPSRKQAIMAIARSEMLSIDGMLAISAHSTPTKKRLENTSDAHKHVETGGSILSRNYAQPSAFEMLSTTSSLEKRVPASALIGEEEDDIMPHDSASMRAMARLHELMAKQQNPTPEPSELDQVANKTNPELIPPPALIATPDDGDVIDSVEKPATVYERPEAPAALHDEFDAERRANSEHSALCSSKLEQLLKMTRADSELQQKISSNLLPKLHQVLMSDRSIGAGLHDDTKSRRSSLLSSSLTGLDSGIARPYDDTFATRSNISGNPHEIFSNKPESGSDWGHQAIVTHDLPSLDSSIDSQMLDESAESVESSSTIDETEGHADSRSQLQSVLEQRFSVELMTQRALNKMVADTHGYGLPNRAGGAGLGIPARGPKALLADYSRKSGSSSGLVSRSNEELRLQSQVTRIRAQANQLQSTASRLAISESRLAGQVQDLERKLQSARSELARTRSELSHTRAEVAAKMSNLAWTRSQAVRAKLEGKQQSGSNGHIGSSTKNLFM